MDINKIIAMVVFILVLVSVVFRLLFQVSQEEHHQNIFAMLMFRTMIITSILSGCISFYTLYFI